MAAPAKTGGEDTTRHSNDDRPGYMGRAERLLGATAILGAAIYALLNVLYVEFYDDFGVRPEEVGWDRLTMLSRTAWVALSVLIATAVFLLGKAVLGRFLEGRVGKWRVFEGQPIFAWFAPALLAVLGGYWYLTFIMEAEADRVARGETVNGMGLFVPFIDVRAHRAEVTWLGETAIPPGLQSPHLSYLGRSRDATVLVACGTTTIVVPSDQVIINIKNQGHSFVDRRTQRAEFARLCR
ncbi:hypothetical protein OWR29_35855 [Actinoplanes sp. Pm04-4]|uniref:Bacterial Pleckstrin homology domain-containing protein n=1 Tax=Paractinoplanes pyxinae TaxID=2997416 RepID=A0ABT4BA69_9ACTN|nr:hypothetical protein [Actinoplanes pyxinae]MCY1143403.1 hypothetical protein [Actinoplanes pyxinae]